MHREFTKPAAVSDLTQVSIEKLVYGGEGLGRVNGQVVLVPFVLSGEEVAIRTEPVKTGLLRGFVQEIIQPSPQRIVPRCEYFAACGGCHYQHSTYEAQLEQKRAILRETLQRLGGISYEDEIPTISGEQWFYRNRVQLHFVDGRSGFHKAGSHEMCAIDHCYISSPLLVEAIGRISEAVKRSEWPGFLRSLEIFTNEKELQLHIVDSTRPVAARFFEFCDSILPPVARGAIDYAAAGFSYRISRGSFFQVNRFLIDALIEEALWEARGERAIDLYAGVGLFSLPLARRFANVDAVERGGRAFRDLEHNASQAANVQGVNSAAEEFLRSVETAPDIIVADPPRAGLGRETTSELLRIKPPLLTIVSCDPSTLARDAKRLLGDYSIRRLALVDLFPQTYHFETVIHLERK